MDGRKKRRGEREWCEATSFQQCEGSGSGSSRSPWRPPMSGSQAKDGEAPGSSSGIYEAGHMNYAHSYAQPGCSARGAGAWHAAGPAHAYEQFCAGAGPGWHHSGDLYGRWPHCAHRDAHADVWRFSRPVAGPGVAPGWHGNHNWHAGAHGYGGMGHAEKFWHDGVGGAWGVAQQWPDSKHSAQGVRDAPGSVSAQQAGTGRGPAVSGAAKARDSPQSAAGAPAPSAWNCPQVYGGDSANGVEAKSANLSANGTTGLCLSASKLPELACGWFSSLSPPNCSPWKPKVKASMSSKEAESALQKWCDWLLFLRHCARCNGSTVSCLFGRNCQEGKKLWAHMLTCSKPDCDVPNCARTREVWGHQSECESPVCKLCVMFRELAAEGPRADVKLRRRLIGNEARRMRKSPGKEGGSSSVPGDSLPLQDDKVPGCNHREASPGTDTRVSGTPESCKTPERHSTESQTASAIQESTPVKSKASERIPGIPDTPEQLRAGAETQPVFEGDAVLTRKQSLQDVEMECSDGSMDAELPADPELLPAVHENKEEGVGNAVRDGQGAQHCADAAVDTSAGSLEPLREFEQCRGGGSQDFEQADMDCDMTNAEVDVRSGSGADIHVDSEKKINCGVLESSGHGSNGGEVEARRTIGCSGRDSTVLEREVCRKNEDSFNVVCTDSRKTNVGDPPDKGRAGMAPPQAQMPGKATEGNARLDPLSVNLYGAEQQVGAFAGKVGQPGDDGNSRKDPGAVEAVACSGTASNDVLKNSNSNGDTHRDGAPGAGDHIAEKTEKRTGGHVKCRDMAIQAECIILGGDVGAGLPSAKNLDCGVQVEGLCPSVKVVLRNSPLDAKCKGKKVSVAVGSAQEQCDKAGKSVCGNGGGKSTRQLVSVEVQTDDLPFTDVGTHCSFTVFDSRESKADAPQVICSLESKGQVSGKSACPNGVEVSQSAVTSNACKTKVECSFTRLNSKLKIGSPTESRGDESVTPRGTQSAVSPWRKDCPEKQLSKRKPHSAVKSRSKEGSTVSKALPNATFNPPEVTKEPKRKSLKAIIGQASKMATPPFSVSSRQEHLGGRAGTSGSSQQTAVQNCEAVLPSQPARSARREPGVDRGNMAGHSELDDFKARKRKGLGLSAGSSGRGGSLVSQKDQLRGSGSRNACPVNKHGGQVLKRRLDVGEAQGVSDRGRLVQMSRVAKQGDVPGARGASKKDGVCRLEASHQQGARIVPIVKRSRKLGTETVSKNTLKPAADSKLTSTAGLAKSALTSGSVQALQRKPNRASQAPRTNQALSVELQQRKEGRPKPTSRSELASRQVPNAEILKARRKLMKKSDAGRLVRTTRTDKLGGRVAAGPNVRLAQHDQGWIKQKLKTQNVKLELSVDGKEGGKSPRVVSGSRKSVVGLPQESAKSDVRQVRVKDRTVIQRGDEVGPSSHGRSGIHKTAQDVGVAKTCKSSCAPKQNKVKDSVVGGASKGKTETLKLKIKMTKLGGRKESRTGPKVKVSGLQEGQTSAKNAESANYSGMRVRLKPKELPEVENERANGAPNDQSEEDLMEVDQNALALCDVFPYRQLKSHINGVRHEIHDCRMIDGGRAGEETCVVCLRQSLKFNPKSKSFRSSEEPWVQCDVCQGWVHQICGLFNNRLNSTGIQYLCPVCQLEALKARPNLARPPRPVYADAGSLPACPLSRHLEARLSTVLNKEWEERVKTSGYRNAEVPRADGLTVRVVYSQPRTCRVGPNFRRAFRDSAPTSFPYRQRVIMLFQRIDGVDVLLFCMYVQEYGSDSADPNAGWVYLAYVDSIKYFRPNVEAGGMPRVPLRTFVYHELMLGYIEYIRTHGYHSMFIWACPPGGKDNDYIMNCHPPGQKLPTQTRLRHWYLELLDRARGEGLVMDHTNMTEMLQPKGNQPVSVLDIPYFDGDYWPEEAEKVLAGLLGKSRKAGPDEFGNPNRARMDRSRIDSELLAALRSGQASSSWENFLVVRLTEHCGICRNKVPSGPVWAYHPHTPAGTDSPVLRRPAEARSCRADGAFLVCTSCFKGAQRGSGRLPYGVILDDFVPDTCRPAACQSVSGEKDIQCSFLETRDLFLRVCQWNHYEFDCLRKAKHSSMMVLYHLLHPKVPLLPATCQVCQERLDDEFSWKCPVCLEFRLCDTCYSGGLRHEHSLEYVGPGETSATDRKPGQGGQTKKGIGAGKGIKGELPPDDDELEDLAGASRPEVSREPDAQRGKHREQVLPPVAREVTRCPSIPQEKSTHHTVRADPSSNMNKDHGVASQAKPVVSKPVPKPPAQTIDQNLKLILHAQSCKKAACEFPGCSKAKTLISHVQVCKAERGTCVKCRRFVNWVKQHAAGCKNDDCPLQWCSRVKNSMRKRAAVDGHTEQDKAAKRRKT